MFRSYVVLVCCLLIFAAVAGAQSPCALLSKAELQEAAGLTVSDGALNSINKAICEYKAGTSGSMISVTLTAKGPADTPDKVVAELNKRKMPAQTVGGIGDGAYAASAGYGMQQLGAFKGMKHVVVTVLIFGAPEAKSKAIADKVARKAVSKL
jgi:hypothetical protein